MDIVSRLAALSVVLIAGLHAQAATADEVFDRSVEIQRYTRIFENSGPADVMAASNQLIHAGIMDAGLAAALSARLARDYPELKMVKTSLHNVQERNVANPAQEYGLALVHALSSLGIDEAAVTLKQMAQDPEDGGAAIKRLRGAARNAVGKIDWYKERNRIMSSKRNHREGDDSSTSMLINLLECGIDTYRDYALDRIYQAKLRDPRLFVVLESQVDQYLSQLGEPPPPNGDKLIEYSIKLLGFSDDRIYGETMKRVLASNAPPSTKKQAQVALNRLK